MQTIGVVFSISPKVEYYKADDEVKVGSFCIAESSRGIEFGKIVEINSKNIAEKDIIRVATEEDIAKNTQNLADGYDVKPKIKQVANQFGLKMKISKCEYTFDKEKLIIHYTAEDRVDFRELVKKLATEFKSRIEMHQINSRDETQIMGALASCGRVCCCKNHLPDFDKVSIKMAKKQGLSLNPQKLNGMCGKLMCCLRYEDEHYSETLSRMPKVGASVLTPDGEGVVKSIDCIKEYVDVIFTNGDETERKSYPLTDLQFSKVINNEE